MCINQNLVLDSDYPEYINFNQENMRNYIRLKTELSDIFDNHLQKFNLNEFVNKLNDILINFDQYQNQLIAKYYFREKEYNEYMKRKLIYYQNNNVC